MSKIILVTGGNRGIGLEICRQLARQGHTVLQGARKPESAPAIEGNCQSVCLEVTSEADILAAADLINSRYGKLDVLINNAGVSGSGDGPGRVEMDEVRQVMDTNVLGAWRLAQVLSPLLKESEDGRIINVSSGMGEMKSMTGSSSAAYRISKLAINGLTRMMASEWAGQIKVNSMCPGWVRTDMGGANAPGSVAEGADTAVWLATAAEVPHGKFLRDRAEVVW